VPSGIAFYRYIHGMTNGHLIEVEAATELSDAR
jgi:hypothetical protein